MSFGHVVSPHGDDVSGFQPLPEPVVEPPGETLQLEVSSVNTD